ncbi:DNA helicase, partial [Tanacetum coccineum]
HELENMMHHFGGLDNSNLDLEIVQGLIHFLDTNNELVQLFRTAKGRCREIDILEFKIRLYNGNGARIYEILASNTLGAIVFDNRLTSNMEFDVIIEHRGMPPKRINKLHQSYMSLQFPLLFIYGQLGFHTELKLRRSGGGWLFQQYMVGVFCCIEQNRLDFIRKKKNNIRSDSLSGLYDAISRGERDVFEVGGRIILPLSFTGGPRYIKIQEPKDVDRVISAELPDPQIDPHGYKVVLEMMIHGPCGAVNMSVCKATNIRDGKTSEADQQDPENTSWIDIPLAYCLPDNEKILSNLIDFIYDQNTLKIPLAITLQHKAIVCSKNETANTINSKVLQMVRGETKTYLSHDQATPLECDRAETEMLYLVEHLNTLKFPGFPPPNYNLRSEHPLCF